MDEQLYHWGIKGMKWGRRRYQNKDGSLTPEGRKRYGDGDGDSQAETTEQKRARLLKSTNAKELYKDRDVLTTQEIQERLNRINWEQNLAKAAADLEPKKKSVRDYVDKTINVYKKADQVYKTMTESTMGKKLLKQLGLEKEKAEAEDFNLDDFYKNINKKSADDIQKVSNRINNEANIRREVERRQGKKNTITRDELLNNLDRYTNEEVADMATRYGNAAKVKKYLDAVFKDLEIKDDEDDD